MGERHFSFRITTEENIEREAQIYNEAPQLLSFFPSGEGEAKSSVIAIDNPEVFLSSFRKCGNGYELVLHNFSENENDAVVWIPALEKKFELHFEKYELKNIEV
jgi:alpha-mannosidase